MCGLKNDLFCIIMMFGRLLLVMVLVVICWCKVLLVWLSSLCVVAWFGLCVLCLYCRWYISSELSRLEWVVVDVVDYGFSYSVWLL